MASPPPNRNPRAGRGSAPARRGFSETLKREFGSIGYVVFDDKFDVKPSGPAHDQPEWRGGYVAEFKLAERALYEELRGDIRALRMSAEVLGPQQKRIYTIDISPNEFCEGKVQREIDDFVVCVYSLAMIWTVGHQTSRFDEVPDSVHRRQSLA